MSKLKDIWEMINSAISPKQDEVLSSAIELIKAMPNTTGEDKADMCYAAGYAAYSMTTRNPRREEAESWLLEALTNAPGHLGSVLYIGYLAIDRKDWRTAASVLFANPIESKNSVLIDRFVEARVYCLVRLENWNMAFRHLRWFDNRMVEDPNCGIILINFLRLLDENSNGTKFPECAKPIFEKIRWITEYKHWHE